MSRFKGKIKQDGVVVVRIEADDMPSFLAEVRHYFYQYIKDGDLELETKCYFEQLKEADNGGKN